ncbi:MAG: hypothetical protein J0L97_03855 [Alphaproteobacteria bacterium]|nr:hypothetical protein [Alphaproteobacteria bacterium]
MPMFFSRHAMMSGCAVLLGASAAVAADEATKKLFVVNIASTVNKAEAIRQIRCTKEGDAWKGKDTPPYAVTTSDGAPTVISFPDCDTLVKKGAELTLKDLKTLPQVDAEKLQYKLSVKAFDK